MYFAVGAYRRKPRILKNLAIDGDGVAFIEMRRELRTALAEGAQQLANVACLDVDFSGTAGQLL